MRPLHLKAQDRAGPLAAAGEVPGEGNPFQEGGDLNPVGLVGPCRSGPHLFNREHPRQDRKRPATTMRCSGKPSATGPEIQREDLRFVDMCVKPEGLFAIFGVQRIQYGNVVEHRKVSCAFQSDHLERITVKLEVAEKRTDFMRCSPHQQRPLWNPCRGEPSGRYQESVSRAGEERSHES